MRPDLTCYLLQVKFRGSTWEALPTIAHISDFLRASQLHCLFILYAW
jgi:hypothetical protein